MRNIADKHNRVISTALLNVLLHLHMRPIHQVVFLDSQGKSYLCLLYTSDAADED